MDKRVIKEIWPKSNILNLALHSNRQLDFVYSCNTSKYCIELLLSVICILVFSWNTYKSIIYLLLFVFCIFNDCFFSWNTYKSIIYLLLFVFCIFNDWCFPGTRGDRRLDLPKLFQTFSCILSARLASPSHFPSWDMFSNLAFFWILSYDLITWADRPMLTSWPIPTAIPLPFTWCTYHIKYQSIISIYMYYIWTNHINGLFFHLCKLVRRMNQDLGYTKDVWKNERKQNPPENPRRSCSSNCLPVCCGRHRWGEGPAGRRSQGACWLRSSSSCRAEHWSHSHSHSHSSLDFQQLSPWLLLFLFSLLLLSLLLFHLVDPA